jgi:hypothetical protein
MTKRSFSFDVRGTDEPVLHKPGRDWTLERALYRQTAIPVLESRLAQANPHRKRSVDYVESCAAVFGTVDK